jgi:hypothetical protein
MTNDKQLVVFGEEPETAYPSGYSTAATAKNLRAYLEAPLRRPWHVAIPLGIALSIAVAASLLLPKMYRSATLILVESEKMPDSFVRSMATETTNKRLTTIRQEILSRTRLEKIIDELKPFPGLMSITEGQLDGCIVGLHVFNLIGGDVSEHGSKDLKRLRGLPVTGIDSGSCVYSTRPGAGRTVDVR